LNINNTLLLGINNTLIYKEEQSQRAFLKFLDLWKDADAGIPEIDDTRKRQAGLKKR
jgi:hypothetical protein